MTVPFSIPGYDAWRLRGPEDDPEWPDFERDASDILDGLDVPGLYTGNGELYGIRLGGLTLTEDQVKRMLGPKHFARVQWLSTDELNAARDDMDASARGNDL
jgi:hypothetical protein